MSTLTKQSPIGIFDSGLGGLSVLQEVVGVMPAENILFLGDTNRQPYGPRTVEEVRRYSIEIASFLVSQGAKMVIIGCNTATVAGLIAAQEAVGEIPVIGMLQPAIFASLSKTKCKKIGVIGTEITAASKAYDQQIQALDASIEVLSVSCPTVLRLAEKGKIEDTEYVTNLLVSDLEPIRNFGADVLILGCTDFTCIRPEIDRAANGQFTIIDPATEATFKAQTMLQSCDLNNDSEDIGSIVYYVTGTDYENFSIKGGRFLKCGDLAVTRLDPAELDKFSDR